MTAVRTTMATTVGILLLVASAPAKADIAEYQRLVTCAAFHELAFGLLSQGEGAKKNKEEIKYHKHKVQFFMELAGSLLDPYHVPPQRIQADTTQAFQGLVERARNGETFGQLMSEGEDTCHDIVMN